MSNLTILGDTSGSVVLQAPAVAGSPTLTLPTTTSTLAIDGPAFSANASSNQTISHNTQTKVLLQTEQYDTNNNFASSTFTPTVAGYYNVVGQIRLDGTAGRQYSSTASIFKNGSVYFAGETSFLGASGGSFFLNINATVPMNGSTDTIEFYIYQYDYTASSSVTTIAVQTRLQGFMVRGL
jgi:hypothetical protein